MRSGGFAFPFEGETEEPGCAPGSAHHRGLVPAGADGLGQLSPCAFPWALSGPAGFPHGRQTGRALLRRNKSLKAPHQLHTHVHPGQDKSPGDLHWAGSSLADPPLAGCGPWSLQTWVATGVPKVEGSAGVEGVGVGEISQRHISISGSP